MTQQINDTLVYKGEHLAINQYLLQDYFNEFPDQRPVSEVFFTALWRKYVVTSEIKNDELLVRSVKVLRPTKDLGFKDWEGNFPLNKKFDWYSGLIRIDESRLTDWQEEGDYFEYIEVYHGELKRVLSFNKTEQQAFKEEQLARFKKTDAYKAIHKEWQTNNPKWSDEKVNGLIKSLFLKRYSRALVEATYGDED